MDLPSWLLVVLLSSSGVYEGEFYVESFLFSVKVSSLLLPGDSCLYQKHPEYDDREEQRPNYLYDGDDQ